MTTASQTYDIILENIARKNFYSVETLETRGRDGLDFHDVSVACIRSALDDAFRAGMQVGMALD